MPSETPYRPLGAADDEAPLMGGEPTKSQGREGEASMVSLSLPHAFASGGLLPGMVTVVWCGMTSGLGLYFLSRCAAKAPHRAASFAALSALTFPKIGRIFDLAIFLKCYGVSISYLIIIGALMPRVVISFSPEAPIWLLDRRLWILASVVVLCPLSFLRKLDSLKFTSYVALCAVVNLARHHFLSSLPSNYSLTSVPCRQIFVVIFKFFHRSGMPPRGKIPLVNIGTSFISSMPVQIFAFTCAQNLFAIYNELRDNSQRRLNNVIGASIGSAAVIYEVLGVLGFLTFGTVVGSNIIEMYPHTLLVSICQLGITIMVLFSFHPARASLDKVLFAEEDPSESHDHGSGADIPLARFVIETSFILLTTFLVSMFVDDLSVVLGFVGATGSVAISFLLPSLYFWSLFENSESKKDQRLRIAALGLLVWGVFVMVVSLSLQAYHVFHKDEAKLSSSELVAALDNAPSLHSLSLQSTRPTRTASTPASTSLLAMYPTTPSPAKWTLYLTFSFLMLGVILDLALFFTMVIGKEISRHPTVVNLLLVFAVSGFMNGLLVFDLKADGEVSTAFCTVQGSTGPLWPIPQSAAILALQIPIIMAVFAFVRNRSPPVWSKSPFFVAPLVAFPWVIWGVMIVWAASRGGHDPSLLQSSWFSCGVQDPTLQTAIVVITAIFVIADVVLCVSTVATVWLKGSRITTARMDRAYTLRSIPLVFYLIVEAVINILNTPIGAPSFASENIFLSTNGILAFLIWMTQSDVLRTWRVPNSFSSAFSYPERAGFKTSVTTATTIPGDSPSHIISSIQLTPQSYPSTETWAPSTLHKQSSVAEEEFERKTNAGVNVPAGQQLRFRKAATAAAKPPAKKQPSLIRDPNVRVARPGWTPSFTTAFRMIILVRFFAGMYSSISDCDEVFNYWEPLHYLVHGKGFQTWEYSPLYAIRSYLYLLVNGLPAFLSKRYPDKRFSFFLLRLSYATFSSLVEAFFYDTVTIHISPHVGRYVLFTLLFAPGFWTASTAFLPSTFAMWFVMIGSAFAFTPVDGGLKRITIATVAFATAAIVGWPFAALLGVPLVFEQLFLRGTEKVAAGTSALWAAKRARNLFVAGVAGLSLFLPVILIDSAAYQKTAIVPLNIINYNLFSTGAGPTLYGTEPPSFYLKNGLLAFNLMFPLALLSLPILAFTSIFDPKRFGDLRDRVATQTSPYVSLGVRLAPMYLWLAVITAQPHKEERFMFPAYGLIVFNGSVTLYLLRGWFEHAFLTISQSPWRTKQSGWFSTFTRIVLVIVTLLSFSRIAALHTYYHAPLNIYYHLQTYELPHLAVKTFPQLYPELDASLPRRNFSIALDKSETRLELDPLKALELRLCLGKEWHRFPSHFLVPDEVEVRFIKSEFDGILPKVWEEPGPGKGLFGRATGVVPEGMNELNKEEMDRYVDISTCHYLVDLDFPHRTRPTPPLEPRYAVDSANWDRVHCHHFLDNEESSQLTRTFLVPLNAWHEHNKFGDYCLLRNRNKLQL
ncbi:alpha-1,2-mannosyltransferase, glycosyltransferase family 22 protein [Pseudohyphozyma bogoriensis]|nr:alpha-1,2-mannosyltransferase, glycosyltransferase family 22 protein [Pseudohyphozyma bogoriensis]